MKITSYLLFYLVFFTILSLTIMVSLDTNISNVNKYLLDSDKLFVQIQYSELQNYFIYFIFIFLCILILSNFYIKKILFLKWFKSKIKILYIFLSFIFIFYFFKLFTFYNEFIIFYFLFIPIFYLFIYLIINTHFVKSNKIINFDYFYKSIFIILILYLSFFPFFYTFDLNIYLSWFNIHNYSLSNIGPSTNSNYIALNYYNNFYNILSKVFSSITMIHFSKFSNNINFFMMIIYSITFYFYWKILFLKNCPRQLVIINYLFLFLSIPLIFNFVNPALQLGFRYLIIFIHFFILTYRYKKLDRNYLIIISTTISFFHNAESFLLINVLNLLYCFYEFNSFFKSLRNFIIITLTSLLTLFISIYLLNHFFNINFFNYQNAIIGASSGYARKFPDINELTFIILIIFSHSFAISCPKIYRLFFTDKKLLFNDFLNIISATIIIYFSVFYFRRGSVYAPIDLIFLFYSIILIDQLIIIIKSINLLSINKSKNFNYLYIFNFLVILVPNFNSYILNLKNIFYFLRSFVFLFLFSFFIYSWYLIEFKSVNSDFKQIVFKDFSINSDTKQPIFNIFDLIEKNNIQATFTRSYLDTENNTISYVIGVLDNSLLENFISQYPKKYKNKIFINNMFFQNFNNFTSYHSNTLGGYNIPDFEYSIIKLKSDFLKNQNFIYFSEYLFFINILNGENNNSQYVDPFNDILIKSSYDKYISSMRTIDFNIAIDCIKNMGNLNAKNFYTQLINDLINKAGYQITNECNESFFTILKKSS